MGQLSPGATATELKCPEPVLHMRSHHQESVHCNQGAAPLAATRKTHDSNEDPAQAKMSN